MPRRPRAPRRALAVTALLSFAGVGIATFAVTGGCATDTIDLADLSAPDAGPDGAATAQPCDTTMDCAANYYCSLPACDAPAGTRGTCLLPPTTCYDDGTPPVCGCDHVTYYNDCLRQKNAVSSSSRGPCEGAPQCGGPGNPACRSGALCAELNSGGPGANACERPILGSCWVLPDQCPATPPGWDFSRWDPCMPADGGGCLDTCTAIYQGGLHRESTHHCQ